MENGTTFTLPYFALALVTALLAYGTVDTMALVAWTSLFALYVAYRTTITIVFGRRSEKQQGQEHALWWRLSNASGVVHGLLWTAYCLLIFPTASFSTQVIVTTLVLGLCGIGTLFASGTRVGLMAFVLLSTVGCAVAWFLYGQEHQISFVIGVIAFASIFERAGRMQADLINDKIRLAIQNADLAQELKERNAVLDFNNREKSRLIATASHDLRQPAHALGMMTERMTTEMTPLQLARTMQLMKTRVTILSEMLTGLLDFSKLESGNYSVASVKVDFAELFNEVSDAFRQEIKIKSLKFNSYTTSMIVQTDPLLVRRILWNLVSNAVKYTSNGGITMYTEFRDGCPQIVVADTGAGIPPERLKDVFRDYYRLEKNRDREEGLGIGLAVVDRALKLVGATLDVQSTVGVGSTFRVKFPAQATLLSSLSLDSALETGPALLAPEGGFRVLIVEDDEVSRDCTADVLSEWNYRVYPAADIAEAMIICSDPLIAPHIVICDLHLGPTGDGIECIKEIRKRLNQPNLPCVLVTGNLDQSIDALAAANRIVLSYKPVQPSRLKNLIKDLLREANFV